MNQATTILTCSAIDVRSRCKPWRLHIRHQVQELILVQARRDHPREICGIVSVRNRARGYTPRVGITSSTFPFLAKVISTYINIATLKFSPILLLIATLKNNLERPVQYRSENQLKVLITCIGLLLFSLILFRENFFDHRSPITALRFSSADHDFGVYVTPSFLHTLLTYWPYFSIT